MEGQVRKSLEADEAFSKQRNEIQAKIDQEVKSRKFIMLMVNIALIKYRGFWKLLNFKRMKQNW